MSFPLFENRTDITQILAMSPFGPKRTRQARRLMSAFQRRADVTHNMIYVCSRLVRSRVWADACRTGGARHSRAGPPLDKCGARRPSSCPALSPGVGRSRHECGLNGIEFLKVEHQPAELQLEGYDALRRRCLRLPLRHAVRAEENANAGCPA
jgi:hypothetical protein